MSKSITLTLEKFRAPVPDEEMTALLAELVDAIRPKKADKAIATANIRELCHILSEDPGLRLGFVRLITRLLHETVIGEIFTESGIVTTNSFFQEFYRILGSKLLPALPDKDNLRTVIQQVFRKQNDHVWVTAVGEKEWAELFSLIGPSLSAKEPRVHVQLTNAFIVLSYKISSLALEKEIVGRFNHNDRLSTPFIDLNRQVINFVSMLENSLISDYRFPVNKIRELLRTCEDTLDQIRDQAPEYGTSLNQSFLLIRIRQQIRRISILLDVLDETEDFDVYRFSGLFIEVVSAENNRNRLRRFVQSQVQNLAYQVAEHKGKAGEHYITSTPKEYRQMFFSSLGGGLIITFAALIKTLLHFIKMAPFWQHFAYGTNYALAFIGIHISGSTLATKQPAMTASSIAGSLDRRKGGVSLPGLAITVAKVWRSQTISFIGNLLVVFPLTLLVCWLADHVLHFQLNDAEHAQQNLNSIQPFGHFTLLFAAFAGFCLFLAGIVSGYFDNMVVYAKIPERIQEHPFLKKFMKEKGRKRLAKYLDDNFGSLMGNFFLGFMLGMMPFWGAIFGLPIDIRHITISTANFAMGIYGLGFHLTLQQYLLSSLGIILIGFTNFFVSFFLAFWVAVRSRGLRLYAIPAFLAVLWAYFKKHPLDFIRPPKEPRAEEDITEATA